MGEIRGRKGTRRRIACGPLEGDVVIVVGIGWGYGGESGAWVVGERGSRTDKDTGGEEWEGCGGIAS